MKEAEIVSSENQSSSKLPVLLEIRWPNIGMTWQEIYSIGLKKGVATLWLLIQLQLSPAQMLKVIHSFLFFFRGVNENFQLVEELLERVSVQHKQVLAKYFLKW
jgi:hypothetical protein